MARDNLLIENATIQFRNFSGKKGQYNPEGKRNFCVFLDSDIASKLSNDGWNIKWLKPRDPEDDPQAYIQAEVKYSNFPPKIVMVTSHGKSIIGEDEIKLLDTAEIETADVLLTPYEWSVNGKTGIKAYVKTLYVKIVEDELEKKYSNTPDTMLDAVGGCGACDECDKGCGKK